MLETIIDQRRKNLGGFEVGRVLPVAGHRMVGPFVFFDHMGPADFPPGIPADVDVRPHPHIGLSTLTYLFRGEIMHRDSLGSQQPIRAGEVNWMTAGRGITHSERFEKARRDGDRLDGIQAWVALPTADEEMAPAFEHYGTDVLAELADAGARGRLIAGSAYGVSSPVAVRSPLFYVHWDIEAGARIALPADMPERALYVAHGSVEADGLAFGAGQMLVFAAGQDAVARALQPSIVIALGGEPVGPRFLDWNFVSSSKERIDQAKADWRAGRMKLPDFDDHEWIPLPGTPAAPEPMS